MVESCGDMKRGGEDWDELDAMDMPIGRTPRRRNYNLQSKNNSRFICNWLIRNKVKLTT